MLGALTVLLVYQLIGEIIVQFLRLPIPGPVVGLLLLFLTLCLRGKLAEPLRDTANGILQHLSLLFVPAGVGVMVHFARVSGEWLPILLAVLISTALAIGVSALVMRALMRGASDDDAGRKEGT
jgi:holin-like protein